MHPSTGPTSPPSSGASRQTAPPDATPGLAAQLTTARRLRAVGLTPHSIGREPWRQLVRAQSRPSATPRSSRPASPERLDEAIAAWRERNRRRRAEPAPPAPQPPPLEERLARCGVPPLYRSYTLDSYARLVADHPAQAAALDDVRGWDGRGTLVIAGSAAGAGKTGLATACLRRAVDAGASAYWMSAPAYLAELRRRQGAPEHDSAEALAARAAAVPLLVLDDLGAERPTAFAVEQLHRLLDHRFAWARGTIVTTNLPTPTAVAECYGAALASRLRDHTHSRWVRLEGADLRASPQGAEQ